MQSPFSRVWGPPVERGPDLPDRILRQGDEKIGNRGVTKNPRPGTPQGGGNVGPMMGIAVAAVGSQSGNALLQGE